MRQTFFLGLFCFLLASGCATGNSQATAAPTLTTAPPQNTPAPDIKIYGIADSLSLIHFQAKLSIGNLPLNGSFNSKGKQLSISRQGGQSHIAIDLQIDGNSVTTTGNIGIPILKGMLDTANFPYGHFVASVDLPSVDLGATPVSANASGTLELHGKTQPVQMPVTISQQNDQITASGQLTIELTDYGVVVPSLIKSKITLSADLVASLGMDVPGTAATMAATAAP